MQYFFRQLLICLPQRGTISNVTFIIMCFVVPHYTANGELAQTGERSLCMREAPGSIPGFSISLFLHEIRNTLSAMLPSTKIKKDAVIYILGSIVVSIPACHAGDQGSIPCRGGYVFQ